VKPTQAICENPTSGSAATSFNKKVGSEIGGTEGETHRNVPWHVVLACEGGGVYALRCVNDAHERPNGGEECGWEDVVSEGAREPPEVGRRVFRDGRGVDQEEEERAGGPDLERHFEVRDLRGFDL